MNEPVATPERPTFIGDVVWTPSDQVRQESRLWKFLQRHHLRDYPELVAKAGEDVAWFWDAAVKDMGVEFSVPYQQVVDTSRGVELARWWIGGKFNIVANCLDRYRGTAVYDRCALIWEGEAGEVRRLTYRELDDDVCRCASGFTALGIGKGDRVALFTPLVPEAAVALLAIAKIGAVAVPVFSGYSAAAVAQRLNDCSAKALIHSQAFDRRGRPVAMAAVADEALAKSPSVSTVIVIGGSDGQGRMSWSTLLSYGRLDETTMTDPEDPLLIIYTSGTTGRPKGTVHVQGGFPVKGLADLVYGFDGRSDDTILWITDIGWMMGPWLVFGPLALGATSVLYDGAPDYPTSLRIWELASKHDVTILGLSPTLVRTIRAGVEGTIPELPHLRVLGSTGEMWDPDSWTWLFERVGRKRVPVLNYCGGTELAGGIVCGNVLTPLRPCSFAGPLPGMAADVVADDGTTLRGRVGELVVRAPSPGMTRGFWQDPERYLETYWSRFPGVWLHGDWAYVDGDGLWYVLGRSDETLNVAGKRLGPAEVEAAVGSHQLVVASAAFGVPDELKGEAVACLVQLRAIADPSEKVASELVDLVVRALGKPFRPKILEVVTDLPRTRNAKVVRRLVRASFLGLDGGDLSSVENPECLSAIAAIGHRWREAASSQRAP